MIVRCSVALVAGLLSFLPVHAAEPSKPDIVLFLADDLGIDDCSPYGCREVPTPNMTRLAQAGMTFTQAFVASPSCAPSRAALLTGLDPMRNGAMLNHSRPRPDIKKWPRYFHELGYEVVAIGKVAHYAQVTEYGFDHASHFTYHEDTCIEAAVRWLKERKSRKPLCLVVGTNWPHVPWPKDSSIAVTALPTTLVDTRETRTARSRYLAAVANADRDLGLIYDAAKQQLGENLLFAFSSDHGAQLPFGKWNCYDAGVRTPLLISWPGHIRPGSTSAALVSWIDLLPTFVAACGGKPLETLSGRSFLEVLTGNKQQHRPHVFFTHSGDGQMNRYPIRAVRTAEWKYIRNLDPTAEHHTHIDKGNATADGRAYWDSWVEKARTDAHAAAVVRRYHTRPAEELYDMVNDPAETRNLALEPQHAGRLKMLRDELDAWMKGNGDAGLKTEKTLPDPRPKQKNKG